MKRLFKLAIVGGLIYGAVRFAQSQKAKWEGLTETELRAKLDQKLSPRMPEEAVSQITENVVQQMKAMGKLQTEVEDTGFGVETTVAAAPETDGEAADEAAAD